jgi:tetratricopeptide (TPR) repeat protein
MRIASPLPTIQRLACVILLGVGLVAGQATAQSPSPSPPSAPSDDAATRARNLDALFARLKTATVEEEADAMVAEIWKLWLQSGRPEVDAAMQQAVDLMGNGLSALAIPLLDDIVARAPDWAEGWNKRATVLYILGEHDRSLADIERVLALEPRHFGALAGIGLIRIAKGEHRAALAAFRRALAVNPFLKERYGLIPALEREIGEKPL